MKQLRGCRDGKPKSPLSWDGRLEEKPVIREEAGTLSLHGASPQNSELRVGKKRKT